MSDWRDFKREANRGIRFSIGWVLGIIAVVLLVGGAIWGISVAISGPKGVGDAVINKNSAENWTRAQAKFEDLYAEIQASDRKIQVARASLESNPTDKTAQQTLQGVQSACIEFVGEYNAEARKFLSEDFRAADLPARIENSDPTTDCK